MQTERSPFFRGRGSAFVHSGRGFREIAEALAWKRFTASSRTEHSVSPTHSHFGPGQTAWHPHINLASGLPASVHTQAWLGARTGSEQRSVSPRTGSAIPRWESQDVCLLLDCCNARKKLTIAITIMTTIMAANISGALIICYILCQVLSMNNLP